jgi:hypothetical protein
MDAISSPFAFDTLRRTHTRRTQILLINIHCLNATANLHLQLPLALHLGRALLKITIQLALIHRNLPPPLLHLLLDRLDIHVGLRIHLLRRKPLARRQQMLVLLHQLAIIFALALLIATHARLVKRALTLLSDLGDARHCLERGGDEVAVVAHGDVAALREGEGGVDGHFLAVGPAEGFCPGEFARVALHFEVLVAFGFAEAEGFGVVADWGFAVSFFFSCGFEDFCG